MKRCCASFFKLLCINKLIHKYAIFFNFFKAIISISLVYKHPDSKAIFHFS